MAARACAAALLVTAVACGGSSTPTSPTPTPLVVTGRWVGSAPDGLIFNPAAQGCNVAFDLSLPELTQTGDAFKGTVETTVREVATPGCDTIGRIRPGSVTGTAGAGTVSLTAVFPETVTGNNGITLPVRVTALIASGTFTDSRLVISGNQIGPRAWNDANRNSIPDCDLANAASNGECAPAVGTFAFSGSATRRS